MKMEEVSECVTDWEVDATELATDIRALPSWLNSVFLTVFCGVPRNTLFQHLFLSFLNE